MGNIRASLFSMSVGVLGLVGCNSNSTESIDAPLIKLVDAAPDAPKPIDAPPDAPPVYDFSCATDTLPTTAANPVTVAGITEQISGAGSLSPLGGVTVDSFKVGTTARLNRVTSGTDGSYTTGNLATGGVPLAGYVEGSIADSGGNSFRTSFVFPPTPLVANLASAPIPMVPTSLIAELSILAAQDDTKNGVFLLGVTDCANTLINGASISLKSGGTDVAGVTVIDLGQFEAQAAGLFIVLNVPDGNVDIGATFQATPFRTHTVIAFKKNGTDIINGSVTASFVLPGS